ncbi:beta family protein [Acinetobacter baumannii]|uniref:beta family protein n=1 Tax=Acinetobacter baumannii TaxID=470 RepID=UPI000F742347|nr:beta family protein [Acinetobacter baumannii]RSQ72094.1 hypothetical protein EA696_03930 [Acinetobacter baumannii]
MITHEKYIPFLKWRQSEYQALFKLTPDVKEAIVPYIIIPPIEYDFEERKLKKTIEEHITPMPNRLKTKWGRLAILDFHSSLEDKFMPCGNSVIKYVFNKTIEMGHLLIPAYSFDKSNFYLQELSKIINKDTGIALRLFFEDLNKPDINKQISDLFNFIKVDYSQVDLIIDLQTPDKFEPYKLFSNLIHNNVSKINNLNSFRSFVISAHSLNLREISQPDTHVTRHEWQIYPDLCLKFKDKPPAFGDYTIENIDFGEPMDMRKITPAAKLIYTLPQHWRILKGRAFRGNETQMTTFCQIISTSPNYKGIRFSDGDKRIKETADGTNNTGNLGVWKQVAINHHMTKVVRQLSSHHAPSI